MNLRYKMSKRVTSVVEIKSETIAIFSDECSPRALNSLSIIEAADLGELRAKVEALTITLAGATRFKPIMALVHGTQVKVIELEAESSVEGEDSLLW